MELEKWIAKELTHGIEVNRKFPCTYDSANGGFGYSITLIRKEGNQNQYYKVMLLRKNIKEHTFFISNISRTRLDRDEDEHVSCPWLEGKRVILAPKEPSTYACEISPFTITGTLTLENKLS